MLWGPTPKLYESVLIQRRWTRGKAECPTEELGFKNWRPAAFPLIKSKGLAFFNVSNNFRGVHLFVHELCGCRGWMKLSVSFSVGNKQLRLKVYP